MRRTQVYPAHLVAADLAAFLAVEHPRLLLVHHPVYGCWQVYERPEGSDWTADRLWRAIVHHHEAIARVPQDAEAIAWSLAPTFWWQQRGAPQIVEERLPLPPGTWMRAWLAERDFRYTGGARDWFRAFEAREAARKHRREEARKAMHQSVAREATPFARDVARGDPLSRPGRWTHTVPIDVKG